MDRTSAKGSPDPKADLAFEQQLREMNEALLIASVQQHELAEQAQKAEGALAKALAYGDDIIATLREPFLVLDHDLRVKTANRSFYDSFHVSKEETENRLVYDLGNGQWDIPGLRKLLNEVLSRSQSVNDFEVEHVFPTLGRKTMLLNARPFPPDSKNPELILLAVYDVSVVQQRADELAELDRRKDEFLAMLSHELRNPLAPILNALQLLQLQKGENSVQQKARAIIERQVGQLAHLVDDLMEVSRITSGRVQLRHDRVVVSSIVARAVETARPLIDQHKHELTVSLPPQPIWLHADAVRLEQVVVNLLTNAAKYMRAGGHIWLTVELEDDEATRRQSDKVTEELDSPVYPRPVTPSPCRPVIIRVRDTGVGIAPELLPHIFDLFTQAERSLDRSQGGLGIGLALVQRLVEMHMGRVEAYSTLGQGSEFVVRLPVESSPAPQPALTLPVAEAGQATTRPLRVLLVDDSADMVLVFSMLMETSGHEVRTAHDGPTAVQAAVDYRPDVVLLDIGLPGLDGFEVARRIRKQPDLQNVVLVAMTGYGQATDRQRSLEAGFDHHLVKPARFELVQKILASVSQSGVRHQESGGRGQMSDS